MIAVEKDEIVVKATNYERVCRRPIITDPWDDLAWVSPFRARCVDVIFKRHEDRNV